MEAIKTKHHQIQIDHNSKLIFVEQVYSCTSGEPLPETNDYLADRINHGYEIIR